MAGLDLAKVVSVASAVRVDSRPTWALGRGYGTLAAPQLPRRRLRLRRQVQHPAHAGRSRLPDHGRAGEDAGGRGPGAAPRRHLPRQRSRRPRALRLRDRRHPRVHRARRADLRHLPRPPDHGARLRRQDLQDEVRPPRRQPPGARTSTAAGSSITSQNHGFAVDPTTLPATLRPTHVSLFDGTLQGLAHVDKPAFCFQGHPEASPGPHDIGYLFDRFVSMHGMPPGRAHA